MGDTSALRVLLREHLELQGRLRSELDRVLPPTPTGYLHGFESWSIVNTWHEDGRLKISVSPPTHAYEWQRPTVERLEELHRRLACDMIYVFPSDEALVYIACWDLK